MYVVCKYTHFFTLYLAVTKNRGWWRKTTYILVFEFSVKSSIRIRHFPSCAKKKVKFFCPVQSVQGTLKFLLIHWQFSYIAFDIFNWSLHPLLPGWYPLCSAGSKSCSSIVWRFFRLLFLLESGIWLLSTKWVGSCWFPGCLLILIANTLFLCLASQVPSQVPPLLNRSLL